MSILLAGNAGVVADVDEARNVQIWQGIPGYPAAGGFYSSSGWSAAAGSPQTPAIVAAGLAANTLIMSARFAAGSARKGYINRLRVLLKCVTGTAAGSIPGILGLQRFTAVTPTGGNARTAARHSATKGSASDMTDIRDLNAALTGSPTFGDLLASTQVPQVEGAIAAGYTANPGIEWVVEFPNPIELAAGDGLALRTQATCPAVATWTFSWNMYWFER